MHAAFLCDDEPWLEIEQAISINKCRGALFINLWLICKHCMQIISLFVHTGFN